MPKENIIKNLTNKYSKLEIKFLENKLKIWIKLGDFNNKLYQKFRESPEKQIKVLVSNEYIVKQKNYLPSLYIYMANSKLIEKREFLLDFLLNLWEVLGFEWF